MSDVDTDAAFAALGGWPGVLGRLLSGRDLGADEAGAALGEILSGAATHAQVAAFIVALRMKGETVQEMTGLVQAMLAHAEPLAVPGDLVDTCGTGGDRSRSVNVSTMAALVVAGAGARVCKHGGRAASSSAGSADVLEALGVVIDLGPAGVARCIEDAGIGFCFAPRFHPAMADTMLGVLMANGSRRAMVVHGADGLDELSTTGPSAVIEAGEDGTVHRYTVTPEELGLAPVALEALRGGDAAENAEVVRRVLAGDHGPHRDVAVLNAAAGLVVAGISPDLAAGVERAAQVIDAGGAHEALQRLVRTSQAARHDAAS